MFRTSPSSSLGFLFGVVIAVPISQSRHGFPVVEEWAWVIQAGACIPFAHTTWAAMPWWLVLNILGVYARAR